MLLPKEKCRMVYPVREMGSLTAKSIASLVIEDYFQILLGRL